MLDRMNKSVQISWISAFLLSIASWHSLPAYAVDASQILGGKVTWECDLSATVESTIRSNQDHGKHGLSCRFAKGEAIAGANAPLPPTTQSAADPVAVNALVQQGIQLLQLRKFSRRFAQGGESDFRHLNRNGLHGESFLQISVCGDETHNDGAITGS